MSIHGSRRQEASGGEIRIGDRLVNNTAPKDRNIAMVFQNYALYPHKTVYGNMAFALRAQRLPKADVDRRVQQAAAVLGLEDLMERKPGELSGGSASASRWAAPSSAIRRCSCSTSR